MTLNVYSIACLAPAVLALVLVTRVWVHRTRPGAKAVAVLLLAISVWSTAYAMELAAPEMDWKLFWGKVQYLGIVTVPLAWFAFALAYSGANVTRRADWIRWASWVPALTLLIAWTNDAHMLLWEHWELFEHGSLSLTIYRYGPWFSVHVAYSYALLLVASVLLLRSLFRLSVYDRQGIVLLVAVAAPWIGNLAYVSEVSPLYPLYPLDLTPFAFMVSGIAIQQSLRHLHFLDLAPIARATVMEMMRDGVIVVDPTDRVLDVNPPVARMLGLPRSEILGSNLSVLFPNRPDLGDLDVDAPHEVLLVTPRDSSTTRAFMPQISPLDVANASTGGKLIEFHDVTDQQAAEDRVQFLAYRDGLTGLPNRQLFLDRFEQAVKLSQRTGRSLACLFIDLDDFKKVNDHYGHSTGDDLLKQAASRLKQALRRVDVVSHGLPLVQPTLARFGGDEFVILLQELSSAEAAAVPAERVVNELRRPFRLDNTKVTVRASVGVAVSPHDGATGEALLANADAAMYAAKGRGGDRVQFFTQEINDAVRIRLETESALHDALERNEFELHYQPQFDPAGENILGVEALLRWNHPERGMVPPGDFIDVAEETGIIVPIGKWVIERACRDWRRLYDETGIPFLMAVNVSPRQFADAHLQENVTQALEQAEMSANCLEIELTEGVLMDDTNSSRQVLESLSSLGVKLAVDDFGTGYSSLGYMRRFPLDLIKIDRCFINDSDHPRGASLVRAIIGMAHNLGMEVVSEGVETQEQLEFLQREGSDRIQGFLLSRPLSFAKLLELTEPLNKLRATA